ncbi:MAG: DUF2341 domain-containing protein [Chitinispirillaceae bacterium]|nr:DUF2341 domain-containing protein [Chitinispirillaceae bacterium]
MVRFIRLITILFCIILTILLALCSRDYNPFSDPGNCEMHISGALTEKDTISIFSTETLSVLFTASGFVKSFTAEAAGNMFFSDSVMSLNPSGGGPHKLWFSFWDTGKVTIRLYMEKTIEGTGVQYKEVKFYVRSPLVNSSVEGGFDSFNPQHFKTEGVSDTAVFYRWVFDNGKMVEHTRAETTGLFVNGVNDYGTGYVYVTDRKFNSPKTPFWYRLIDTIPPRLTFRDPGTVRGDTLICSWDTLYKKLVVTDSGSGSVEEVRINGEIQTQKDTIELFFPADIGVISFYLKDGSPNRNHTTVQYYVKVDTTYSQGNGLVQSSILFPGNYDTVATEKVLVFTQVERLDRKKLHHRLLINVNNTLIDSSDITENYFSQRMFQVPVSLPENVIRTVLYDRNTGDSVDCKEIIICFNKDYKIDLVPVILDVQFVNTRVSGSQTITDRDTLDVRVVAFDDKGAVENVYIDKTPLACEKNGYQWSGRVPIPDKFYSISVVAVDSAGNRADSLFQIVRNNRPVMVNSIHKKLQIAVNNSYRDTMKVSDADKDSIVYGIVESAGKDIVIINRNGYGILHWTPSIVDTSSNGHRFIFFAKDGHDEVRDSVLLFVFKDSSDFIAPVDFKTIPSEISATVESGRQYKYKLELRKGIKGVTFDVRTDMDSVLMSMDTLILRPQINDTGYHKVTVTAKNQLDLSDTLYTSFIVIPPNRKPQFIDSVFLINGKAAITITGGIDSFISFPLLIHDPDSAGGNAMKISVSCVFSNAKISSNHSGAYELKIFNPNEKRSEDTLILICEDNGGLSDTLVVPVHYLDKLSQIEYITPENGEYQLRDTVWFRWKKAGGVSDAVYTIHIDGVTGAEKLNDTTAFKIFQRSDTYRWRVIATSGIDTVTGEWRSVSVRVPRHIEFKTTEQELKKYCFAGVDTYTVQLHLKDGTGTAAGNRFFAQLRGRVTDTITIPENGMFTLIPLNSDTGEYDLLIFASDSIGNADTLKTHLSIVAASSCVINLKCADTSLYTEKAVDLYGDTKETSLLIGLTRSAETSYDTFNLKVTSRKLSVDRDADSAVIHLKRPDQPVADDTLVIVVRNKKINVPPVRDTVIIRYNIPVRTVEIASGQLNLTAALSDVPVLLRLNANHIGFARKSGFRFLINNNTDTLSYQINSWNAQTKTTEIWVRFNTITPAGNNTCVMQYGYQLPDKSDGGAVFDTLNNYKWVYHFDENDKSAIVKDATAGRNDGILEGSYSFSDGVCGYGVVLKDMKPTTLRASKDIHYENGEEKTFIYESWIKRVSAATTSDNYLFSIKINDSIQCGLVVGSSGLSPYYECYDTLGTKRNIKFFNNTQVSPGEWKRVSFIANVFENKIRYSIYVDKEKTEGVMDPAVRDIAWTSGAVVLGSKYDLSGGNEKQPYNGQWDEIWVSKGRRTDDWIRFMYECQKLTGGIVSVVNQDGYVIK